jgi:O-6-methylguanine DNA methyltransferase
MTPSWHIAADERGVTALRLRKAGSRNVTKLGGDVRSARWRAMAARQLRAYFSGRLRSFSVPYDIGTLPQFSRAVLNLVAAIPYGETRSYQCLARRLGRPRAARAVGNALARNPLPIIIPCHRVVRGDGTFDAFVLGPGWKKRLLRLEKSFAKTEALEEVDAVRFGPFRAKF